MGDTLQAKQPKTAGQIPLKLRLLLPASNQPRKFDQLAETERKQDNSMRLEIGNYLNSPHGLQPQRNNSSSFLFGNPRELMALLNNYPVAQNAQKNSGFSSYYPPNREFSAPEKRRGDSICLPPPVATKEEPQNQLRSTSIFSSLIQMPGSSSNSFSGPSKEKKDSKDNLNLEYLQDYEMNRDSLSNIFGWNQEKTSKRNTKTFDNQNAFWEQFNTGNTGSIAGLSSDNMNAILSSMQSNPSIDLQLMNNEQRRDSILRFINDQGKTKGPKTSLREDIFKEQKAPERRTSNTHLSPTSSMSSKASKLQDEPQSPKASPDMFVPPRKRSLNYTSPETVYRKDVQYPMNLQQQIQPQQIQQMQMQQMPLQNQLLYPYQAQDVSMKKNYQYAPQTQIPNQVPNQPHQVPSQVPSQMQNPQLLQQLQNQYLSRGPNYSYQGQAPMNMVNVPKDYKLDDPNYFSRSYDKSRLVPAQQYARAEDGRPLLGATKVDQLMLVIQAREKGNKNAIRQAPDGSIMASPNPDHDKSAVLPSSVDLVGGVEKLKDDGHDDKRRKRRAKNQECPYCFKKFNQSTHLDVHVRSHIGYKPFQCSYCQKRFTQGGNLRTHLRLHTGEKPFSCEVCNRSFSRKGNLAAHMLTHNKEKPFECKLDDCDKSFTQLGNLKSHQNKFHLPTLTKLTQTFSSITGDALDKLPKEERAMLDYFGGLYKNSNKGIRGRGKG